MPNNGSFYFGPNKKMNENLNENMNKKMSSIQEKVLQTLSFFEAMNLERLILDLDTDLWFFEEKREYSEEDLNKDLTSLSDLGLIKNQRRGEEVFWIRTLPAK